MSLPSMPYTSGIRKYQQIQFLGYNHNLSARDGELWDMKNVTITPHISGLTDSYAERSFGVLETNLKRWQKGDKLVNEVNRKRGY